MIKPAYAHMQTTNTDQTAHPCNLNSIIIRYPYSIPSIVAISKIPRGLLLFVAEQSVWSLTWSHDSLCRFSQDVAQVF